MSENARKHRLCVHVTGVTGKRQKPEAQTGSKMIREMFTTKDVAEYLGIHEKQVYRLIRKKKIPATRVTGKYLFPKKLLEDWIVSDARKNAQDASYSPYSPYSENAYSELLR